MKDGVANGPRKGYQKISYMLVLGFCLFSWVGFSAILSGGSDILVSFGYKPIAFSKLVLTVGVFVFFTGTLVFIASYNEAVNQKDREQMLKERALTQPRQVLFKIDDPKLTGDPKKILIGKMLLHPSGLVDHTNEEPRTLCFKDREEENLHWIVQAPPYTVCGTDPRTGNCVLEILDEFYEFTKGESSTG